MASFDTNLVLRFLLNDVPAQSQLVQNLVKSAKPNSLRIDDAVLFEVVWILAGPTWRLDRPTIGDLLMQLTEVEQFQCNRGLVGKVVPLYIKYPGISFIDACLSVSADMNGVAPLLTFDKKLAKALPAIVQIV